MYGLQLGGGAPALEMNGSAASQSPAAPVFTLLTGAYWRLKRPAGLVLALLLVVLASPLLAGIALALAYRGRPILIRRRRLGQFGKPFTCYYFRTMVPHSLQALYTCERGHEVAVSDALGRFLLRTRLDRLPMLFNVLRGDMNLVGPRPLAQEELIGSGRAARHTLSVRPGITGLWWTKGEADLKRRLALDRSYIEHASPLLDVRILLRTVVLMRGSSLN